MACGRRAIAVLVIAVLSVHVHIPSEHGDEGDFGDGRPRPVGVLVGVNGQAGVDCNEEVFQSAFACQRAQNDETGQNVRECCNAVGRAEASLCYCDETVVETLGSAILQQLSVSFLSLGCGPMTVGTQCPGGSSSSQDRTMFPAPPPPFFSTAFPSPSNNQSSSLDRFPVERGLQGYWFLSARAGSEVAVDASGNGNEGTYHGNIKYRQPGASSSKDVESSSSGFNGFNTYVEIPYSSELNTPSFSVSVWTRATTSPRQQPKDSRGGDTIYPFQAVIESTNVFDGSGFMLVRLGTDEYRGPSWWAVILGTENGFGSVALVSDTEVAQGAWYHIVVTYDNVSRELSLYVDGFEDVSGDLGALVQPRTYDTNSRAAMRFGGGVAAHFYSGDIQHVGVWDRELTEEEVLSLYLAGAPNVFSQSVLLPTDGNGRDNAREAGGTSGTTGGTQGNAQSGDSQSSSTSTDNDNLILIIIIAVVGIILILAILILIILLLRRRRRKNTVTGLSTRRTVSRTKTFDGLAGMKEADDEEILLDSVRTPLTSARATHAPEVAKTMTNNTFVDEEAAGSLENDEGDFDVEESASGRRKPRFTRKGSRIHVRFME